MSHSFFRKFLDYTKVILENKATRNIAIDEIGSRISILTTVLVGHGIYALSTQEKDDIIVTKKYKMDRNGFTDFMIVDNKGRHFNVNNSFWYWKWDSIEDWHKIDEKNEEKLLIKYYGWRVPVLGLFPNIVISDRDKSLNSMSSSELRRPQCDKIYYN